jgi:L-aspartate oxidase
MSQRFSTDILIIGAGAAGLAAALRLADHGRVAILRKGGIDSGSTAWAQGGIAAVSDPVDSDEAHAQDTMIAGAGLCRRKIVELTIRAAGDVVKRLTSWGVDFDRDGNEFHLTREGGHSARRVLHVADATGRVIADTLTQRVLDHPNIELFDDRVAIDLIRTTGEQPRRCIGAYAFNRITEYVEVFQSRYIILATGGASKVYLYTSNPDSATGDGIAMAWRAGCRVANMEFNQFHPTCLFHPHAKSFLLSEALRGEGAVLRLPSGERFMDQFDPRAELAPRDIVARAIDHEMKRLGADCVYLDISHRPATFIESHFPTILKRCAEFGFDLAHEPVPVVPAAHYTCGGVMVDPDGATDVKNLYAVGEVSCTGLHGANRLASNSLLECLVFGERAASHILSNFDARPVRVPPPQWDESRVTDSDEDVVLAHNWDELRRFMWDYVGIVRTRKRLERARRRIDLLKQEVHDYYSNYRVSNDLIELRNLIHVAELIVRSALGRRESRGLHFTLDFPEQTGPAEDTVLTPPKADPLDVLQPVTGS